MTKDVRRIGDWATFEPELYLGEETSWVWLRTRDHGQWWDSTVRTKFAQRLALLERLFEELRRHLDVDGECYGCVEDIVDDSDHADNCPLLRLLWWEEGAASRA